MVTKDEKMTEAEVRAKEADDLLDEIKSETFMLRAHLRAAQSLLQDHTNYDSDEQLIDVGWALMNADKVLTGIADRI